GDGQFGNVEERGGEREEEREEETEERRGAGEKASFHEHNSMIGMTIMMIMRNNSFPVGDAYLTFTRRGSQLHTVKSELLKLVNNTMNHIKRKENSVFILCYRRKREKDSFRQEKMLDFKDDESLLNYLEQ
ncbi:hypothetical protein E2320_015524, partial [Naja naja]